MVRTVCRWLAAACVCSVAANAGAVSVYLSPITQIAGVGDVVEIDVYWDFSDEPTLGGGTDVLFDDTLLAFVDFQYNLTDAALDPDFTYMYWTVDSGLVEGIATGNFYGIGGPQLIGTLSFETLAAGSALLSTQQSSLDIVGPFVSLATFSIYQPGQIIFQGAGVGIGATPVAAPSPTVLVLAGSAALLGAGRRR